jgi:hypothetical protein
MISEIYNQFSDAYNKLYIENLLCFQSRAFQYYKSNEWFVNFYPSFGIKPIEKTDFLFIGQAVNGWGTGFNISSPFDKVEKLRESISYSNNYCAEKKHTPLDWVNIRWTKNLYNEHMNDPILRKSYPPSEAANYWASKSFFWNVTFKTLCDYYTLGRNSWAWSGKMVWTNLYKIAPEDANPNNIHCCMQQPFASELIKFEINELKPKHCIVPTNLEWWLPFRFHLNTNILKYDMKEYPQIAAVEKYNNTLIIITNRPYVGNTDEFASQIIKTIKYFENE